jgi:arsenite-transporting ATPase
VAVLLPNPTAILFFTGKGGVGKTSCACATALGLAGSGRRVLLVSTDPASNLDEVLGVALSGRPLAVPGAPGLSALNLDPGEAAAAYRKRLVDPVRGLLPAAVLASMEEQLSGACTTEIAAFDEFARLLGDPALSADFEHILFDTAPTGHTLRLLELPSAWSSFINGNSGGNSCLGPLSGLAAQKSLYEAAQATLRDPSRTTLVLVARPDRASLREAERTRAELAELGIGNLHLLLNGLFTPTDPADRVAAAWAARAQAALAAMPAGLCGLARTEVPLLPFALVGLAALRRLGGADAPVPVPAPAFDRSRFETLAALVAGFATQGRGVIMTMGKGGVGKTTLAARIATQLAGLGLPVTLTTTDPAAHVQAAIGQAPAGLRLARIDPALAVAVYRASVLATAGAGLDAAGRALLEEDLRSPCTEEIAVFRAFAETVAQGLDRFVIIDTAPTGHTLLLLDAAEAYHREVLRTASDLPDPVRQLLPRLRDPAFTRILLVTLAEATPIHEAMQLEQDLARAGIRPCAWVVNQSLAPLELSDPLLRARQAQESGLLDELLGHAGRVALEPLEPSQQPPSQEPP